MQKPHIPNNAAPNEQALAFEHSYLRTEIETNKKFVFERALLIAGAALAATLVPQGARGIELLGIPVIGALAFNLWFTVNRLKSNSRIIAYIQIFHEAKTMFSWVGWENALRLYRHWYQRCPDEVAQAIKEFDKITEHDNISFYQPILLLHIAMAISIAVLMSFNAWTITPITTPIGTVPSLFLPALNLVTAVVFVSWAIWIYRPRKLRYGIEKNLIIWNAVFRSYNSGCLKNILANTTSSEEQQLSESLDE